AASTNTVNIKQGSYTGTIDAASGGKNITLSPGASAATVTNTGNLSVNTDDTLSLELNGVGQANYDNFVVTGSASLAGATLNLTTGFGSPPTIGTQFML